MPKPQARTETTWFEPFGGVCQALIGEKIPPNLASDGLNYETTEEGEMQPRNGARRRHTSPDGLRIRSQFTANFDGVRRKIVATAEHVYEIGTVGTFSTIYTIPAGATFPMAFAVINGNFNPVLVFGNGNCPLQKWTGTGASSACQSLDNAGAAVAGHEAPRGRPINFKGYLAVFGIMGKSGKVQFNYLRNGISSPDHWLNDGTAGTERYLEATGEVAACAAFQGLVMFTMTGADLFSGNPDSPGPVSHLSTTIGCVSHESVADCDGILVWKSKTGAPYWDGGGKFPTDYLDSPRNPAETNISKDMKLLDMTKARDICGVYIPGKQTYLFSADITKGTSTYRATWSYNFKWDAWWPWSLAATSFSVVEDAVSPEVVLCGTADGGILELDSCPHSEDDDVAFESWVESGDLDMALPDNLKVFRGFIVGARGVGIRHMKLLFSGDFGISGAGGTVNAYIGGFILGVSRLDRDRLGLGQLVMSDSGEAAARAEMDIDPGGYFVGSTASGTGSHLGDILQPARPYVEEHQPFVLKTKHIRIRFYGPTPEEYQLKNIYKVPIARWALRWRVSASRRMLMGSKRPKVDFITFETVHTGAAYTFANSTTNDYYVFEYEWKVNGVVIPRNTTSPGTPPDGAPTGLVYNFSTPGTYTITLTAKGRWEKWSERTSTVVVEKTQVVEA